MSQPSLGPEDHPERTTPPLSPMYSSDGQSAQISASSRGSKIQVIALNQPSTKGEMETHWEEAIHCSHPEKKWEKLQKKLTDISIDDDTESELRAITESDMSDSTLQSSVQDFFEEMGTDQCFEKSVGTVKSPKENYISHLIKVSSNKDKPTWIIGSEDESVKSFDNRIQESKSVIEYTKNCSRLNSTSSINGSCNAKSVTSDFYKQVTSTLVEKDYPHQPTPLGKHKKIIEPSITPVCTPVSDCDDSYKISQTTLPPPSVERLLPIGSARLPGTI